jgi:hypothetical protein
LPFEEEYLMETSKIVAELDAEIARLQEVRALLVGGGLVGNGRRGRKAGARKKRVLSAEARAKISAAQKKRWAKQKKAAKKAA